MNIQDLKSNTTWQEASNTINNNNNKISLAIATLENAKLKNKGYFTSVEKLNEAIPNPTIGSKAYVGTSEPYAIYIVENGVWVDSGYTGGDEIVAKITTDRIENGAVTIDKIESSIQSLIASISKNATFAGIATPTTNPGTPEGPVFYLATQAGTYANFGGIEVVEGEASILQWSNGTWSKKVTGFATQEKLTELEQNMEVGSSNILLQILDVTPDTLSAIPYGVIEFGVSKELNSGGIYYLKCSHYRDINKNFNFIIENSDPSIIGINLSINIENEYGLLEINKGYWHLIIDCNLLKNNPVDTMDLGTTAPINFDKLCKTSYSKFLKEQEIVNSHNDYKICYSGGDLKEKTIPFSNFHLIAGDCGKIKMIHKNTYPANYDDIITLNIQHTGNYPLYYNGKIVSSTNTWNDNEVVDLYFDGTNYYANNIENPELFVGTDGTINGKSGLVPAPLSTQKDFVLSANGNFVRNDGYIIKEQVSVNTNSQRDKNYTSISLSKKIVVRVSNISGTSSKYNFNWITEGGKIKVFSGMMMGYLSDVLEVPSNATGINIFMNPAANGNINLIEIFDATKSEFLIEKLNYNIDGIQYLNNRQIISFEQEVIENDSSYDIMPNHLGAKINIKGKFYILVEGSAQLYDQGRIRLRYSDNTYDDVLGFDLRQNKLFTFETQEDKTLSSILILANSIKSAGILKISLFAVEPSTYFISNPLCKKNIMCFGDSITEFKSNIDLKTYSDHLAILSQANVYNAGIGGTRLSPRDNLSLTPSDNQQAIAAFDIFSLIKAWSTNDYQYQNAALSSGLLTSNQQTLYTSKLDLLKNNPIQKFDIITIFGGTNDYTGGSTIGSNSLDNLDERTIHGAINGIIKYLLEAKSTLKIYGFTPIIRMFNNTISIETSSDVYIPNNAPEGKTLAEFGNIIETSFKNNHIPVNNWYWSLGWGIHNFTEFFGSDYTHPYRGFKHLAERIYQFILNN